MHNDTLAIQRCLDRGVIIPAPHAVVLEDINPENIAPGTVLYPGTCLQGQQTYVGANSKIGQGGGAHIQNAQLGANVTFMQGCARDCTLLDGVSVRNGAEIREGCLLEEGVDIGHTVGLKQTIFLSEVVAGSLINFCDALMAGGTSRKNHSEIGSCTALYNFTPQGDKFASCFGDVPNGVFLRQPPIFVGGQTQIVSPVLVGYGSVIGAGSKISQNVPPGRLILAPPPTPRDIPFEPDRIWAPLHKITSTLRFIGNLHALKAWYQWVRQAAYQNNPHQSALTAAALLRITAAIEERQKRLRTFCGKLPESMNAHQANNNPQQVREHRQAMTIAPPKDITCNTQPLTQLAAQLAQILSDTTSFPQAIRALDPALTTEAQHTLEDIVQQFTPR